MSDRKRVQWWADTLDVLRNFPDAVKQRIGFALDQVQLGGKAGSAKPIPSVGKGVYAITTDHATETYRTFYVARFPEAIYVFYTVHKKSTTGISLPKHQQDLAAARYREIEAWRRANDLG